MKLTKETLKQIIIIVFTIHDDIPEFAEFTTIHWFSVKICDHVIRRTIFHLNLVTTDTISDKIVADVDMSCPLATGRTSILGK